MGGGRHKTVTDENPERRRRSNASAPYAAEAEMARRCVDRFGVPGGRPVAAAIIGRTEMRAAFYDLTGIRVSGMRGS